MKRIFAVFILVFSVLFSPVSAEIPDGFKGYPWGTDFWTIDKDVDLYYAGTTGNGVGRHGGYSDAILSGTGELLVLYEYRFYNNLLIEGFAAFYDKAEYDSAVASLKSKFSVPPISENDSQLYFYKNTAVLIAPWDYENQYSLIIFSDFSFFKKLIKEKGDQAYNHYLS